MKGSEIYQNLFFSSLTFNQRPVNLARKIVYGQIVNLGLILDVRTCQTHGYRKM